MRGFSGTEWQVTPTRESLLAREMGSLLGMQRRLRTGSQREGPGGASAVTHFVHSVLAESAPIPYSAPVLITSDIL